GCWMPAALIVTTCSNRKRIAPLHGLRARDLAVGTPHEVADSWASRLAHAKAAAQAKELYCGRNFAEARNTARDLRAPLYVVSAGLGLVSAEDVIPSYALTVSPGSPDSIHARISPGCSAQEWWDLGASRSPFSRNVLSTLLSPKTSEGLVLVALPGS